MTTTYYLNSKQSYIDDPIQSEIFEKLITLSPHHSMYYTWDDIGTATLMKDIYDSTLRYCPQTGDWYIYDGSRWEKQGDIGIVSDMLQTVLNLLRLYCDELPPSDIIENYSKYINSIRKHTAMRNITEVLKTMVRMAKKDMDSNPYILNTPRCAYDLRTGEIITDTADYNITMCTSTSLPAVYQTTCNRWYTFIDEVMNGNKERAAFLQRAAGYSLLGVNREECMFVLYGAHTRNGKGTFVHAIRSALGEEYASAAPTGLICESKNGKSTDFNAPQPTLSRLVGTRFVELSEPEKTDRLDAASLKTLTGRDVLVTRGLYESSFSFIPQFTLWLETNHLPAVTDDTVFKSDRLWVIDFERSFDENERDRNLKEAFSNPENRPTILKWLMDGCKDYIQNGLNPPQTIRESTENYRVMHDRIGNFIRECCIVDPKARVLRGTLYTLYRQWCRKSENNFQPLGSTTYFSELSVRGFSIKRRSEGWYIEGLGVLV